LKNNYNLTKINSQKEKENIMEKMDSIELSFWSGYHGQADRFKPNANNPIKKLTQNFDTGNIADKGWSILNRGKKFWSDWNDKGLKEASKNVAEDGAHKVVGIVADIKDAAAQITGIENPVPWKAFIQCAATSSGENYRAYCTGRMAKDVACYTKQYWPQVIAWGALYFISTQTSRRVFALAAAISLVLPPAAIIITRDKKVFEVWKNAQSQLEKIPVAILANLAIGSALGFYLQCRGYVIPHELWTLQAALVGVAVGSYLARWLIEASIVYTKSAPRSGQ
jgi:hypothetical protein